MADNLQNWAGHYTYKSSRIHYPKSVAEVQSITAAATKAKALGTRHSFNDLADTEADHISTKKLDQVIGIDKNAMEVRVQAGIRYGVLAELLHMQGFALHNMASLPHISVGGACASATHGSGDQNGNLATAVRELVVVVASGDVVKLGPEQTAVGLGALGTVVEMTLEIEPTYEIRQEVFENLTLEALHSNFDAVTSAAYSVSLFTDWQHPVFNQVWLKHRMDEPYGAESLFGARAARVKLHPLPGAAPVCCTEQLNVPGNWQDRLPHFKLDFTPSAGEELQTEYIIPRNNALAALEAVYMLSDKIWPALQITEVRTMAADDLWMSMNYQQPSVGIHFTWKKDWAMVEPLLPLIEEALLPLGARPHWGKLFSAEAATIQPRYPRFEGFRKLSEELDPTGKFRNAYLDRHLFGTALSSSRL